MQRLFSVARTGMFARAVTVRAASTSAAAAASARGAFVARRLMQVAVLAGGVGGAIGFAASRMNVPTSALPVMAAEATPTPATTPAPKKNDKQVLDEFLLELDARSRADPSCGLCTTTAKMLGVGAHVSKADAERVLAGPRAAVGAAAAAAAAGTTTTTDDDATAAAPSAGAMPEKAHVQCPPGPIEFANASWTFLHSVAAYYPEKPDEAHALHMESFIRLVSRFYPCDVCAEHLREYIKTHPVTSGSRAELVRWMCDMHNDVNRRLGKPQFDCANADRRWHLPSADDECDGSAH